MKKSQIRYYFSEKNSLSMIIGELSNLGRDLYLCTLTYSVTTKTTYEISPIDKWGESPDTYCRAFAAVAVRSHYFSTMQR